jgi:hypothetical protein
MILRRLGDAVARQDWFVVLIELVVLVVGIFIGLQVDKIHAMVDGVLGVKHLTEQAD